jgi:serine protease Do
MRQQLRIRGLLIALLILAPLQPASAAPGADEDAPFTFGTFRDIARKQLPCVVNIVAEVLAEEGTDEFPLFRFYRDAPSHPDLRGKGTGSGLIITADGYVVTNSHVVESSGAVEVTFYDGSTLPARIVGRDPQLDIALLKVEPEAPLQIAALGDSDRVEIGDWVLAIGSPYGLSHSVSAGIVSALGRDIHSGAYDSFIQTDAAINRGNSGGPLFSVRGEVVGINTAILSSSGGSNGIGFAIPINQVRDVLEDLKVRGEVVRGWLGIGLRDIVPKDLEALGLEGPGGVVVTDVWTGSPAAAAGMLKNDVIVRFGSAAVRNTKGLLLAIARAPVGSSAAVEVLRKGRPVRLSVLVAARPDELRMTAQSLDPEAVVRPRGLGAVFQSLDEKLRGRYGLENDSGFVITEVETGSAAETAGLQAGDLLVEINRTRISTAEELLRSLRESKGSALLLVRRGTKTLFFSIDALALKGPAEVQQN